MPEIIRTVKKRDIISSVLYIFYNLAIPVLTLLILHLPTPPEPSEPFLILALAVVVLSKWRIFAVKVRFWIPNLLSALVDFIFSAGMVVLLWQAVNEGVIWLQVVLVLLYAAWLIVLKPMTKELPVLLQAGISQFIGITALFVLVAHLSSITSFQPFSAAFAMFLAVFGSFVIAFAAARHILMLNEEPQHSVLAATYGLVASELAFMAYHWSIIYGFSALQIPEIAIILTIFGVIIERIYTSFRSNKGQVKSSDVLAVILFGAALLVVLLIFFSGLFSDF